MPTLDYCSCVCSLATRKIDIALSASCTGHSLYRSILSRNRRLLPPCGCSAYSCVSTPCRLVFSLAAVEMYLEANIALLASLNGNSLYRPIFSWNQRLLPAICGSIACCCVNPPSRLHFFFGCRRIRQLNWPCRLSLCEHSFWSCFFVGCRGKCMFLQLNSRWTKFLSVTVPFVTRVVKDYTSGNIMKNEGELARDLRIVIEKLGPTFIKARL